MIRNSNYGCDKTILKYKDDLPVIVAFISFSQYGIFPMNLAKTARQVNCNPKRRHLIICNFLQNVDEGFHELLITRNGDIDKKNVEITYKQFKEDYDKPNANIHQAAFGPNGVGVHSYLVDNNKYLVAFQSNNYNVYDMESDKWLLNQSKFKLRKNDSRYSRSVLINDEIIIISSNDALYFYSIAIAKDHITNPLLIGEHKFSTENVSFSAHGMCVIDFKIVTLNNNLNKNGGNYNDNNYNLTYEVKILLFGGTHNFRFFDSFVECDISLSFNKSDSKATDWFEKVDLSVEEILVGRNEFTLKNVDQEILHVPANEQCKWGFFGYECTFNDQNEAVIIIVGGDGGKNAKFASKSVRLYNCKTHKFKCIPQV